MALVWLFFLPLLCQVVHTKAIKVESFALTLENGKTLTHQGRFLDTMNDINVPMTLDMHYDGTPLTITDLKRTPVCSIASNVKITSGSNTQVHEGYLCSTLSNDEYDTVFTVDLDGAIEGLVGINGSLTHLKTTSGEEESGIVADIPDLGEFDCGFGDLLPDSEPLNGRRLALSRWTDCYAGDTEPTTFSIGIKVGSTIKRERYKNDDATVIKGIESIVALANTIYARQLNIYLVVNHIIIAEGGERWDNVNCSKSIFKQFDDFVDSWPHGSDQGLWHMIDDCFKGSGTIGTAYPGTLCSGDRSASAISYYSTNTWLTFAHEVGHNHGAGHSFEEGVGTTGGIMDYGTKILNGVYQFNEKYRKNQICTLINTRRQDCAPYRENALDRSSLGNGIIDLGEECDCEGQLSCNCCVEGKLRDGAVCAPAGNPCCTDTCEHRPVSNEATCTLVDGSDGYCNNGQCTSGSCKGFGIGQFCEIWKTNSCRIKCYYGGECITMHGWKVAEIILNHVADDVSCERNDDTIGVCKNGECVEQDSDGTPPTSPRPTGTPTANPTKHPTTPIPSRTPTSSPSPQPIQPTSEPTSSPTTSSAIKIPNRSGGQSGSKNGELGKVIFLGIGTVVVSILAGLLLAVIRLRKGRRPKKHNVSTVEHYINKDSPPPPQRPEKRQPNSVYLWESSGFSLEESDISDREETLMQNHSKGENVVSTAEVFPEGERVTNRVGLYHKPLPEFRDSYEVQHSSRSDRKMAATAGYNNDEEMHQTTSQVSIDYNNQGGIYAESMPPPGLLTSSKSGKTGARIALDVFELAPTSRNVEKTEASQDRWEHDLENTAHSWREMVEDDNSTAYEIARPSNKFAQSPFRKQERINLVSPKKSWQRNPIESTASLPSKGVHLSPKGTHALYTQTKNNLRSPKKHSDSHWYQGHGGQTTKPSAKSSALNPYWQSKKRSEKPKPQIDTSGVNVSRTKKAFESARLRRNDDNGGHNDHKTKYTY